MLHVLHATVIRPRPFVLTGVPPLLQVEPDNGFPSDHALQVGTLLAEVTALEPGVAPAYALGSALTLGARLGAGLHHTGDVVGGLGLAGASAVVVYRLPVPASWRTPLATILRSRQAGRGPAGHAWMMPRRLTSRKGRRDVSSLDSDAKDSP